jgi:hypothetical protein
MNIITTTTPLQPGDVQSHIDLVQSNDLNSGWLTLAGWVASPSRDFKYVAVYSDASPRFPITIAALHARPDVNGVTGIYANKVGFRFDLEARYLPAGSTLYLVPLTERPNRGNGVEHVTLYDHRTRAFAVISLVKNDQSFDPPPTGCTPVFVTSLGRSGSTVVCSYLGSSANLFNYQRYPSEARVVAYWLHLLQLATAPADPGLGVRNQQFADNPSIATPNPFANVLDYPEIGMVSARQRHSMEAEMVQMASRYLTDLAHSCGRTGNSSLQYVEKCVPGTLLPGMAERVFPQSRELILVRHPLAWCRSVSSFFVEQQRETVYSFSTREALLDVAVKAMRDLRMLADYIRLRAGSALVVSYERFVAKDEALLDEIARYLGVSDLDPSRIDVEVSPGHRTQPALPEEIAEDEREVAALLAPFARQLGYEA